MRKENTVWNVIPSGWYISGGMIVPRQTIKFY